MSGGAAAEGEGKVPPSDAVLFILVCFSCGVLIRLGLKWTRIPYTAMLLLVGLGIGFLQLAHPATEAFTNTLQLWLKMEPHLLLLIFLPVIGFSAAIGQEPHMLRKSWGQIMLLAWPGVVIQFLLIALCAKYFFPYQWTWPEAFLFGAMMSATDPVAVVAVLQEVGASQKLACVIDGESLMNDGSALVIFLLLQRIVEGESVTVGGAIAQFCLLAVVGMVLGVAFGAGTSWLLEHIFRDPTLTTIVTLLSAYASYYTADRLVGASGLLAVVMNGFTMSIIGGRQLTLRAEESMHAFWGVLEWAANTILFVWMGIMLAIVLPPSHEDTPITHMKVHLVPSDAGYMIVLFLWLQAARAVLILLCWLPFNYTGYPLTWQKALVFVWGGLRGAVGMVMALFVFLDDKIHNPPFRSYCVFYMATMAFFTVLLNGGTCKWLLRTLGFMSYTPEQLTTLQHVVQDMDTMRDRELGQLRPDKVLGEPEPDVVKMWTNLPTGEILAEAAANTINPPLKLGGAAAQAAIAAGLDPQLLYDYRCRMLHMVKAHYAEAYAQHLLSTMQVRSLQATADKALDEAGEGLLDWSLLQPSCQLRGLPRLLRRLQVHHLSPTLVQAAVYQQNLNNLTLLVGFIHAHRHAQDVLMQHIKAVGDEPVVNAAMLARTTTHTSIKAPSATSDKGGLAAGSLDPVQNVLERFRSFESLPGARGGAEALFVLQESSEQVAEATALAERLTHSHPSLPAWLRSKQVAATILTEQHEFLQHLADAGLVQQREVMLIEDMMHERFKELLQSNTGLSAALHYSRSRPPINLLPLFDSLSDAEAAQLMGRRGGGRTRFGLHKDNLPPSEPHKDIGDAKDVGSTAANGTTPSSSNSSGGATPGMSWRVFYPEQVIAHAGDRVDYVIVITKGAIKMHFPGGEEHIVVASVGDPLGVCELMLGKPRAADLTAETMVQALLVPTPLFMRLVPTVPGIYTRAWQATAAQLAAQHHHILGEHRQLAPLNMFFRSCVVERMEPGQTFDVPRTALLLTGSVRALLPLPASFSLAVQNPQRTVSAADLLWPANIGGGGNSSSSGSLDALAAAGGGSRGGGRRGGGGGMDRQSSAPPLMLHAGSMELAKLSPASSARQPLRPPHLALSTSDAAARTADQPAGGSPESSSSNNAINGVAGGSPRSTASSSAAGSSKLPAAVVAPAGSSVAPSPWLAAGEAGQVLAAPAELPPGEFQCLELEAMVLQVPRGPTLPNTLETTTYQAQVLGKGSIHPTMRLHAHSTASLARSESSGSDLTAAGAGGLRSPLKGALARLTRVTHGGHSDEGEAGGSTQQHPGNMTFLQRALHAMHAERRHDTHGNAPTLGGPGTPSGAAAAVATAAAAGAAVGAGLGPSGGSGALHTVVEIRQASNRSIEAAAAATGAPQGPTQRLSSRLRATDVVLHNASLRRRVLHGGGHEEEPPLAPAAAAAVGSGSAGGGSACAGAGAAGLTGGGSGGGGAGGAEPVPGGGAAAGEGGRQEEEEFVPRQGNALLMGGRTALGTPFSRRSGNSLT